MPDNERDYSNIRSTTPYYRSIPRGIANVGRSLNPFGGERRDLGAGMLARRAYGSEQSRQYKRQNYRNGSR